MLELFESLADDPPNCKSIPPNWTSSLDKESPAPGISTALLGIRDGGGNLARTICFPPAPAPLVTAAGLIGLNADPGAEEYDKLLPA